jgi:KDO2-lipid IV(A) lauroyltransferase
MARKRSLVVDYLLYVAVRFVVCILQMLSYEWSRRLADGLAWLIYKVDRRHRLVADDNLRHAFGEEYNAAQRDQIVRAIYRHFLGLLITLVHLPRAFHVATWKRYAKLPQAQPLLAALLSGRPILLLTGHFGNWEFGSFLLGVVGFRLFAVARSLDNPFLDRFLRAFRQRNGQTMLDKNLDYDRMLEVLQSGGHMATLADQDAGERGLYVDFFNRPASTHKAIALMALQFDAPIVLIGVVHDAEPMVHEVQVYDIILPADYGNRPDAVKAITQRFTTALQEAIKKYPEQYFWLHRRWKHQPKAKQKKKAA